MWKQRNWKGHTELNWKVTFLKKRQQQFDSKLRVIKNQQKIKVKIHLIIFYLINNRINLLKLKLRIL